MTKTVLITGASSGIGKAAARAFSAAGWLVAATLRKPEKETELGQLPGVKLYALDVTSESSVKAAFEAARRDLGPIEVVVNNAGYAVDGAFEAMSDAVIQDQFNSNVFGLMRVTREAIAAMRETKRGVIIQVSSMGGRITFPLFSIYHATKWAVEGFSESLQYELKQFNIRLKLIEPGAIKTDFYGRSRKFVKPENTQEYDAFIQRCEAVAAEAGAKGEAPEKVAQTILKAASDGKAKLRYPVGDPAPLLLWLRRRLPESWFYGLVRSSYKI